VIYSLFLVITTTIEVNDMNRTTTFAFLKAFNKYATKQQSISVSDYNGILKRLIGDRLIRKLEYSVEQVGGRIFRNYNIPVDLAIISVIGYRKDLVSNVLLELDPSAKDIDVHFVDTYLHKYNLFSEVDDGYSEQLTTSFNEGYLSVFEMSVLGGVKCSAIYDYLADMGLIEIVNEGITRRLTKANASPYISMIRGYRKWSLTILATVIVLNYIKNEG
jgi:hypothetical protein